MTAVLRLSRSKALTVLFAVAAALLLAIATQPWWLAPVLVSQLSAASGRSVRIDSARVGLSTDLTPVVRFRGVLIQNAAWADSNKPFAAVREVVAILSWRSVAERRPVIAHLILRDGEVDLERQADGLRNWRLRDPENRGPGVYKLLALQAERASIRFRHDGVELDLVATSTADTDSSAASPPAGALPLRLGLKGHWRKVPFEASLSTGSVLTFLETSTTFALRGRVEMGSVRIDLDGRAGDIFRAPVFAAQVALAGDTLAPLQAFLGPRYQGQTKKAFRIEGRLEASENGYALSAARARIGKTDLAGEIGFARADDRGMLRAKLQSDSVDVADLRWLAGRTPPAARDRAGEAVRTASSARAAQAASEPPGYRFARATDAAISIDARRIRAADLPWLRSLSLDATLADGRLAVAKFDAGVAQAGHATGRLDLDLRNPTAVAEGELALRGLRLETLLPEQAENKRLTGLLNADARVKASGDSTDALRASATGSLRASLTGGSISSLLDAQIGLQGGKIVRSMLGGAEAIPIRCAVAAIDLRHGAGRVRSLVFDTERTRTTGTGKIDFGSETIDLVLTPESKQGGLFVLDRSIRLHGSLRKPERELVARAEAPAGARGACPA